MKAEKQDLGERLVRIIRAIFGPFERALGEPEPLLDNPPRSARKRA